MTLTIEDKIKILESKILEAERVIWYTKNPSQEQIDAQILMGVREGIINQVEEQGKIINILNGILIDLKNGIDQIG